jgi:hypothetical protein
MAIEHLDSWLALPTLPALTNVESAIAKAWLVKHRDDWDSVTFNMRLGAGVQMPPGTPIYIVEAAKAGTQKRTDIIAHRHGNIAIVEVKKRISLGSLGQLLGYRRLYLAENPQTGHVDLVAAALSIQADIEHIFTENNISVELFPNAVL